MGVTNSTHFRVCWELSIRFQTLNALEMLQSMGEERPRHFSAYENCLLWATLAEPQQPGSVPLGVPRGEASSSRGQCWVLDRQGLEIREVSVESLGSPPKFSSLLLPIDNLKNPEQEWNSALPPHLFSASSGQDSLLRLRRRACLVSLVPCPNLLNLCFRLLCWCCGGKRKRAQLGEQQLVCIYFATAELLAVGQLVDTSG